MCFLESRYVCSEGVLGLVCILWVTRSLFMTDYKFSMLKCDTETEELGNTSIIVFLTDLFQHVTARSPGGSKTNGGVCIVSVCWGIMSECAGGGFSLLRYNGWMWWGRMGGSNERVRVVTEWLSTLSYQGFPSGDVYLRDSTVLRKPWSE